MEYRIPKKGEIYRHFKGNLYEIVLIARDSETLEEKVVYKEIDGEAAYVRSLPMFVSYVDKQKYPGVKQEFRFELVERLTIEGKTSLKEENQNEVLKATASKVETETNQQEQDLIMGFLDLSSMNQKLDYLLTVKDQITDNFITIVANSFDFTENEGDLQERYTAIIRCLRTKARYETGRLR